MRTPCGVSVRVASPTVWPCAFLSVAFACSPSANTMVAVANETRPLIPAYSHLVCGCFVQPGRQSNGGARARHFDGPADCARQRFSAVAIRHLGCRLPNLGAFRSMTLG